MLKNSPISIVGHNDPKASSMFILRLTVSIDNTALHTSMQRSQLTKFTGIDSSFLFPQI